MSMTSKQIQALKAAAENIDRGAVLDLWLRIAEVLNRGHKKVETALLTEAHSAMSEMLDLDKYFILSLLAERDADKALIAVYSDAYKEASYEEDVNREAAAALAKENSELKRKIAEQAKRIAELEARMVKIPYLPDDCDRTEAHFKYQSAIAAAGIILVVEE